MSRYTFSVWPFSMPTRLSDSGSQPIALISILTVSFFLNDVVVHSKVDRELHLVIIHYLIYHPVKIVTAQRLIIERKTLSLKNRTTACVRIAGLIRLVTLVSFTRIKRVIFLIREPDWFEPRTKRLK